MNKHYESIDTIKLAHDKLESEISKSLENAVREKENHYFKKNINLLKRLMGVIRISDMLEYIYQKSSTNKEESREERKKLIKIMKLITNLMNELASTSAEIKAFLDILISKQDDFSKFVSKVIRNIDNNDSQDNELTILKSEQVLAKLQLALYFFLDKKPPKKGGPNKRSIRKEIIRLLVSIFRDGKGGIFDPPVKNGKKSKYRGEVVDFVLDMEVFLEKLNPNISLGANSTIGQTILNVIKEHEIFSKKMKESGKVNALLVGI